MSTNDEEFIAFFETESDRLRRFAVLMCGNASEGADLAQEAFARAYARWSKVNRAGAPAYTRRIVVNLIRSRHRRELVRRRLTYTERHDESPYDHLDGRLDILEALEVLSPQQRATILMRYFEDRSEAEISVSLDRPIGTVKSDIHRALRRLRERIEPEDPMTRERGVHGAR